MNASLHIYAVVGTAVRGKDFNAYPFGVKAHSIEEAEGIGLRQMREYCPIEKDWHSHTARAIIVPLEWSQELCAEDKP